MTNRTPWQAAENMALAELYFEMIDAEQDEQRYSKADHIRAYRGEAQTSHPGVPDAPLANRSRGSIEFKLMNATACHQDLQADGILPESLTMHDRGYRALPNYQATLRGAVLVVASRRLEAERYSA